MVYYIWMVQPKTPPRSIRPGVEREAHIQAWATDHGLTLHAATLALIDLGLDRAVVGPEESRLLHDLRALVSGPERVVRVVDDSADVPFVPLSVKASDEPLRMPRAPIGSRLDKKLGKTKR